jgi:predicted GIY-YIG superfamily endonuclease
VSETKEYAMSLEARIKQLPRQKKEKLVSGLTSLDELLK